MLCVVWVLFNLFHPKPETIESNPHMVKFHASTNTSNVLKDRVSLKTNPKKTNGNSTSSE